MQQSVLSLEYVHVPVSAAFGSTIDPTSDTVQMAFTAHGADPISGDWKAASWLTDTTVIPNVYYARCLIGPNGTVVLTVALWDVWVKVTDNPEAPAHKVGELEIT